MAVAQAVETTDQQRTPSKPARKQPLAHLYEHPHLVKWLAIDEPSETRDVLAKRYISATKTYRTNLHREPEIVAELKAMNREIVEKSGGAMDKAVRRQSALIAELGTIEAFHVEAAQAHIDAANALGAYLERRTLREANAATDAINATIYRVAGLAEASNGVRGDDETGGTA